MTIHHVFACKYNIGDWLAARAIQSLLHGIPVKEYLCDEAFVPETIDRLSTIPHSDLIVIGGGGLFMDYFAPFWYSFVPLADMLRFSIWGVGNCAHKESSTLLSSSVLRAIVSKSVLCVVRDRMTATYLDLNSEPVPCPSMVSLTPPAAPGYGVLEVVHPDLISAETCKRVARLCRSFSIRTGRPYYQVNNKIANGSEGDLQGILNRYAKSDVVISSRLHGCIIAISLGKKIIAISADYKIDGFMKLAGLGDWVCDPFSIDEINEKMSVVFSQPVPSEFLFEGRRQNYQIAEHVRLIANSDNMAHVEGAVNETRPGSDAPAFPCESKASGH